MTRFITSLPDVVFVAVDPAAIRADLVAQFEELTSRPLLESHVEQSMVDLMAYCLTLGLAKLNEAGKQTLAQYAGFPALNYIGAMKGVYQRDAEVALTTLRFDLTGVQGLSVLVPQGTRVQTADGKVIFATSASLTIIAGATYGSVAAAAQTPGLLGNDFAAGQVATLMDTITHVLSAANTSTTAGGDDVEDLEAFRARVLLAPEGYSTAGPKDAYAFHVGAVSSTIVDVAVVKPAPGQIVVYPLTETGAPSAELLDLVEEYISDDKIRPMTDEVSVLAPTVVARTWTGDLVVYADADAAAVQDAAEAALDTYAGALRIKLGQAHIPEQVEAVVNALPGVYRFTLTGGVFETLDAWEWLNVTAITVNLTGVAP